MFFLSSLLSSSNAGDPRRLETQTLYQVRPQPCQPSSSTNDSCTKMPAPQARSQLEIFTTKSFNQELQVKMEHTRSPNISRWSLLIVVGRCWSLLVRIQETDQVYSFSNIRFAQPPWRLQAVILCYRTRMSVRSARKHFRHGVQSGRHWPQLGLKACRSISERKLRPLEQATHLLHQ